MIKTFTTRTFVEKRLIKFIRTKFIRTVFGVSNIYGIKFGKSQRHIKFLSALNKDPFALHCFQLNIYMNIFKTLCRTVLVMLSLVLTTEWYP